MNYLISQLDNSILKTLKNHLGPLTPLVVSSLGDDNESDWVLLALFFGLSPIHVGEVLVLYITFSNLR